MEHAVLVLVIAPLTVVWVVTWFIIRFAAGMPRLAVALFWFWTGVLEEWVRSFLMFIAPFVDAVFCALLGGADYC